MGRVIVVGSIGMDTVVSAPRQPRPGETLWGTDLNYYPGGKGANQAIAAARAGAETHLLGAVGDDTSGHQALAFQKECGVNTDLVRTDFDAPTQTALIVVSTDGQNSIVVVPGASGRLGTEVANDILFETDDVVVCQYEIPLATVTAVMLGARAAGATTVLNPAPAMPTPSDLLSLVDVLVVNETELCELSGVPVIEGSERAAIEAAVAKLREISDKGTVIATLGKRGVLVDSGSAPQLVSGHPVEVIDTTGAGDCFVGNLAARLAAGDPVAQATDYANTAASLCVGVSGAGPSMPTADRTMGAMAH